MELGRAGSFQPLTEPDLEIDRPLASSVDGGAAVRSPVSRLHLALAVAAILAASFAVGLISGVSGWFD